MDDHLSKVQLKAVMDIRHLLNKCPELSGKEDLTARAIISLLKELPGIKIMMNIGGKGIIAVIGSGRPGKTVMFRAEMDALLTERSIYHAGGEGRHAVAHLCGHDGHMAVLIGLARLISEKPPDTGRVIFLFQPAEENGTGAAAVMNDPGFRNLDPDYVFAFHNLPGFPLNTVIIKEDLFTAEVKSMILYMKGKASHAAEPEKGANPAGFIAALIRETEKMAGEQKHEQELKAITPVHIRLGEPNFGTAPSGGEAHFTLRTNTGENMVKMVSQWLKSIDRLAKKYDISTEVVWSEHFTATQNHRGATSIIRNAARDLGLKVHEQHQAFRWGEDFGLFTGTYKGALFGIGAGEDTPALHHDDYDFQDKISGTGIQIFHAIIKQICGKVN